jgi:hypothetical protein
MSDPRLRSPIPMIERSDAGTAKRHEDLAPIWVRLRPASSIIESWRLIVDQHLKVRAALDKTRDTYLIDKDRAGRAIA